jgi:hypothetical protein
MTRLISLFQDLVINAMIEGQIPRELMFYPTRQKAGIFQYVEAFGDSFIHTTYHTGALPKIKESQL